MKTNLKNSRKLALLALVAAVLVPQVASAKGGGGFGGGRGRMASAPAYHRAPSHPAKVTPTVSPVYTNFGGNIGTIAKNGTTGTTTSAKPGLSSVYTNFGGNIGTIAKNGTTGTTTSAKPGLSSVYTNFGGNIGAIAKSGAFNPTTSTNPTCPNGNCGFGGGFPLGFGLGLGLGSFGGYGGYGGGYGGGASAPMASTPAANNPVAADPATSTSTTTAATTPAPAPANGVIPASYAEAIGTADLVVEDIQMIEPATLVAGPAYRVKFRNQGSAAADAFRVGIFAALDGQLTDSHAVVAVSGLAAGATAEATLRLPQSAVKMVSTSSHLSGFDKLAVMVDVDQNVHENDKTNNAAVVDRSSLEAAH